MTALNTKSPRGRCGKYDEVFNGYVYKAIEPGTVCLDVGCWVGNLGRRLIREKKCTVDGVDSRSDVLKVARRNGYRKTYKVDLNCQRPVLHNRSVYDYIILADVLEHLVNPQKALESFKPYLRSGGKVVVSVPNIAFALYRLEHFLGKFEYDPTGGVMDSGHLRFFTKGTIERMCQDAGYKVVESRGYSQVKNRFFFLKVLGKLWPELFCIQTLLVLE